MADNTLANYTRQYLVDYARILEAQGHIGAASQVLEHVNRLAQQEQASNVVPIR
ncbi:hypothetical protein [Silvibacterium acidisoli]|uniref:hypothetical protein n=1 Tax=Acidobacteriaceae bacterium ZG23-2 TaxID=2883246 RepID=UPI00406C6BC8